MSSEIIIDQESMQTIVFRTFNSIGEAEVIKSVLDSAGIWSSIENEYMSSFYPVGVIYPQIVIRREDFERAQALIVD